MSLEPDTSTSVAGVAFKSLLLASAEIVRRVKERLSIPVGLKLSPTLEPLEDFVESWDNQGTAVPFRPEKHEKA